MKKRTPKTTRAPRTASWRLTALDAAQWNLQLAVRGLAFGGDPRGAAAVRRLLKDVERRRWARVGVRL